MNCRIQVCLPDLDCQARKLDCERLKAQEDVACGILTDACEIAKATQNALYIAEKAKCEADKIADHILCLAQKEAGVIRYTGDLLFPMTYNLFIRSGVVPITVYPVTLGAVSPAGFVAGEVNLEAEIAIRNIKASTNRDDVGDDLNDIVMLLISRLRGPTPISEGAIVTYKTRDSSFGSYFETYCAAYGPVDTCAAGCTPDTCSCTDNSLLVGRITEGIRNGGWTPNVFAPYGAVRWYHRAITGANPKLATLYEPIIGSFLE